MESLDPKCPKATAKIPLMEGTRQQMAKALLDNEPYYSMLRFFPQMAESAADLPEYILCNSSRAKHQANQRAVSMNRPKPHDNVIRTEEFLKNGMAADFRRFTLFHAIPRQALESVVLGTVAYDYHGKRGHKREQYKDRAGFGIYAIGLTVDKRDGAWLTANELKILAGNLKKYVEGYDDWTAHRGRPKTAQHRESWEFVLDVDNRIGAIDPKKWRESGPQLRFCASDDGRSGMRDLIRTLEHMVEESLKVDPAGDTHLVQTPLYIGCSVGVGGRLDQHGLKLNSPWALQRSNKAFGVVACLMSYQGLQPKEVGICVARLWDTKDIPYSEALVCSLANSLICQDGFNRVECGDSTTNKPLDKEGEEYIKARVPYLHANLTASLREIEARSSFIQEFREVQPQVDDHKDLLDRLADDLDGLDDNTSVLRELETDCKRAIAAWEASQEKLRQELAGLELFNSFLDSIEI